MRECTNLDPFLQTPMSLHHFYPLMSLICHNSKCDHSSGGKECVEYKI
jgi:hypothetical protein